MTRRVVALLCLEAGTKDKPLCILLNSRDNWRYGYFPPSSEPPNQRHQFGVEPVEEDSSQKLKASNQWSTLTPKLKGRRSWFDGMVDEVNTDGSGDGVDSGTGTKLDLPQQADSMTNR